MGANQLFRSNSSPITNWIAFTPTGSWSTNTTYTGFWRRVGDTMDAQVLVATAGAPDTATLTVTLPLSLSFDTTKLASSTQGVEPIGWAMVRDTGIANYPAEVFYDTSTTVSVRHHAVSGALVALSQVTQAAPMTFGNTDQVILNFSGPIAGW